MKETLKLKTFYHVNSQGKFIGESLSLEELLTEEHITVAPPRVNLDKYDLYWNSTTKTWDIVATAAEISSLWEQIDLKRKELLAETDWAVLPDVELSEEKRNQILKYRQILRDLPSMYSDPREVVFPQKP